MNYIADPFYGASDSGKQFAHFLNRTLFLIELVTYLYFASFQIRYCYFGNLTFYWGTVFIFVPLCTLTHQIFFYINKVVLMLVYGTSNQFQLNNIMKEKAQKRLMSKRPTEERRTVPEPAVPEPEKPLVLISSNNGVGFPRNPHKTM